MSRGFVKESDQEELPLIPARAPLPAGVTNYVTPTGLRALRAEREELEAEKAALPTTNEDEHRRATTVIDGKLALLNQRITGARPVDLRKQPEGEVRFGATVHITFLKNSAQQQFQIVGVDEADVKNNKLAFTAPIVRALTGLYEGEVADFNLGGETRQIRVDKISYGLN
ncbi:GreA/GreB family elongation factor [Lewinella sp. 4G2]|uniref:GreA/GreB family elongation factor n=1 Tax=Lewinella sp. 4G2 TaxID=1803372 RepID=UPI0007B4D707|nr:GreA/GreB family elongation factor [Lewinella sp. 4G2]OAV42938.1 transcription elongation factor GreA [Lewinella sp. 4G2]